MHDTALDFGKLFFETYVGDGAGTRIVEIGAQDLNGSLRSVRPPSCDYVGIDICRGDGVDIVLADAYSFPFDSDSVDVCVCSSCFEHTEFFWVVFAEIFRILKPSGLFYLNVPSNGTFHRHPVDCWRFYPDSGAALQNWARRCGYDALLLESFIGEQKADIWNDFVAVFLKGPAPTGGLPRRMQQSVGRPLNALSSGRDGFANYLDKSPDQLERDQLRLEVAALRHERDRLLAEQRELLSSTSWKVTVPLRLFKRVVGGHSAG